MRMWMAAVFGGLAALAAGGLVAFGGAPADAVQLPAPAVNVPAGPHEQVAVLAGGCFWGMEGLFEHVNGVRRVTSGFAGGAAGEAQYETVSTGTTGHAESVRIVFDPRVISYGQLLQIYFSVAHDPTEVDRQGPDEGRQYRSAIFPQDAQQARVAAAYVAQLNAAHRFGRPIATHIERGGFYPAEGYHQHFMRDHPSYPYIVVNDAPKLVALRAQFPRLYSARPVA